MFKGEGLRGWIPVAGVILIAVNLRAPITSVGPVLSEISDSLGLSTVQAGMLTTIPVLAFGLLSGLVSSLARRFRMEGMLFLSLVILTAGLLLRPAGNTLWLFTGTALIGAAITVGNVLMPAYIKLNFSSSLGLMTGLYAGFMNLFAALASGLSIGLGQLSGLGWKGSVGAWAITGVVAGLVWIPQVIRNRTAPPLPGGQLPRRPLWRSSLLAWQITAFMGLQSILFYSLIAWLPEILRDWGMDPGRAGWMLSYIQLAQLPVVFAGPVIGAKMKSQTPLIWVIGVSLVAGLLGVLIGKTALIIPSVILIGVALGLAFSLAMLFLSLRSRNGQDASALSGMAQSFGYLFAASGPIIFGLLHQLTGVWTYSLAYLLLMAVLAFLAGISAARDRYV